MREVKISLVCPTFNSEKYITRTLETVLNQSKDVFEIIISDDGSTDLTIDVVEKIFEKYSGPAKCCVIRNKHKGPGATRNSGILAANGDWISFLDSDDVWLPDKIKSTLEAIKQNPNINFICHSEYVVQTNGKVNTLNYGSRYNSKLPLEQQIYSANMFSTSAVTCNRKLLLEHGLFDNTYSSAQDYELWVRLSPYISVYFISEVLGKYIERNGNITSGSLIKRFKNEFKIASVYRGKVSGYRWFMRVLRIILSYTKQLLKKYI